MYCRSGSTFFVNLSDFEALKSILSEKVKRVSLLSN